MKIFCFFLALFLTQVTSWANNQRMVLALADIQNRYITEYSNVSQLLLREKVVSSILQNYDCFILSRSRGYSLATENAIAKMALIDQQSFPRHQIPAADYVVDVTLEYNVDNTVAGTVCCIDLDKREAEDKFTNSAFSASSIYKVHEAIARTIAESLSLPTKQKSSSETVDGNANNLTWTILPFLRNDIEEQKGDIFDDPDALSQHIELVLREQANITRLVGHEDIDAVLEELKAATIYANENVAGSIARMVGADRILLGTVSRTDDGFRIDAHVVDAMTAVVIAAASGSVKARSAIPSMAASMSIKLAGESDREVLIKSSLLSQRQNEADIYLKNDFTGELSNSEPALLRRIHNAEAAYFLTQEDEQYVYRVANALKGVVKDGIMYPEGFIYAQKAADLIETILSNCEHSASTPAPLLLRAECQGYVKDFSRSLTHIERHIKRYPTVETSKSAIMAARANLELGQVNKAKGLLGDVHPKTREDSLEMNRILGLISKAQGDVDSLYEALKRQVEQGEWLSAKDADRYLELMQEKEGAKETIRILKTAVISTKKTNSEYPILYTTAKCYVELDRKEDAARCCQAIIESVGNYSPHPPPGSRRYSRKAEVMLNELRKELGNIPDLLQPGCTVRTLDDDYNVYIVPVGVVDARVAEKTAEKLAAFLGKKVIVQPNTSLPANAVSKQSNKIEPRKLWDALLEHVLIYDDALMVVFISGESFPSERSVYSENGGNPVLISYKGSWFRDSSVVVENVSNTLAKRCLLSLRYAYLSEEQDENDPQGARECSTFPCLFSESYCGLSVQKYSLALCSQCLQEYRNANFDEVHEDLMDYLKKSGARVVKPLTQPPSP